MDLCLQIKEMPENFTASERKLASVLMADYPYAGLETIYSLAQRTHVFTPSISRFVQKLGCSGYQDFQRHLIEELKEGQQSPNDLRRPSLPVDDSFLQTFLQRTSEVYMRVGEAVTDDQFKRIGSILADRKRKIFHIGGRVSNTLAQYLSRHLRQIRKDVFHLLADSEIWPDYLLRMTSRDAIVMVDFRRYEPRLTELAERIAIERRAQIILITDKWLSPIAQRAKEVIALPIEVGTAWDTYLGAVALMEALIARVSEQDWDATQRRIGTWDKLRFTRTGTEIAP